MLTSYKELTVWQKAIELVKEIYKVSEKLPKTEMFVLSSQMRRSSISIPSNIAEGYKRKSRAEYTRFLEIANASASELETQLIITKAIYPKIDVEKAAGLLDEIQRMLTTMVRTLHPRPSSLTPQQ